MTLNPVVLGGQRGVSLEQLEDWSHPTSQVEKDGRRLGEIYQGQAFGELAVLRLTSGPAQSVTIKATDEMGEDGR